MTDAEHKENWSMLKEISIGNRFRMMKGLPLLPDGQEEGKIQVVEEIPAQQEEAA